MTREYRILTRVYDLRPGDRILHKGEAKVVAEIQSLAAYSWFIFFTDGSEAMLKGSVNVELLELA